MNESFTGKIMYPMSYPICRRINSARARAFYYQFIYCHLINGIRLYANLTSSRCTNKIFLLQKRAFRLIANVQYPPGTWHPLVYYQSLCICCVSTEWWNTFLSLGACTCSGFWRPKTISVAISAKLHKSATEKRNPKRHLSVSVAICDRKHANRILRSKARKQISATESSR